MARWFVLKLPTRERLLDNRWVKPFAHRLAHPQLWQANRRSVARGIALGLFAAFLVPIGQTPVAAFLALSVRANVIVAACATLVTNPLTFPPIYFTAYKLGQRLLGNPVGLETSEAWLARQAGWLFGIAVPTGLGLLVFGVASAAAGYCFVHLGWRLRILRRWSRRTKQRSETAGAGDGSVAGS
jgi:uncharacterized protein (DUF2062 family)